MADKNNLKTEVDNSIKNTPYPMHKLRGLGLQYSVIPKEDAVRMLFYLDSGSQLQLASKALQERLTVDELVRRLIWSYNSL